jgi:hypothetical protein
MIFRYVLIIIISYQYVQVCHIDGSRSINVPLLERTQPLKMFNVLFAHLFSFLAKSQTMQMYQVGPSKQLIVKALLDGYFPAIQSMQDQPTPFVSFRTIGHSHTIVIDALSANHSSSVHARAIQNETTTGGDLDKWDRDGFCKFQSCMTDYFEGILKMQGASGLVVAVAHTRTFLTSPAVEVASVLSQGSTAGENELAQEEAPADPGPAGADTAAAAEPAATAAEQAATAAEPAAAGSKPPAKPAPAGCGRCTNASAADKQ